MTQTPKSRAGTKPGPATPARLRKNPVKAAPPVALMPHERTHETAPQAAPIPPSGVLERGICILECFTEERLRLQLREIAALTGLDKATVLRLAGVLVRAGMVHRFDDGSYAPGPSLLHMGMLYRRTFDVGSRLQPALHQVMLQTGETVAFYVRSGDERVCLYRENSSNEVRHHVEVGTRIKLSAGGSSAHVLKAYTGGTTPHAEQIRTEGFAITREERIAQMASVALPVFDSDDTFLGALVVIGLAPRQSPAAQRKAVQVARRELAQRGFATRPPKDWKS
jgi:DNA-binding IclR family transcriptional regulator